MSWVVIVPAKGRPGAKSRLGVHPDSQELGEAFVLDTVAALLAASVVSHVFVVTADAQLADRLSVLGADIVPEVAPLSDPGGQLNRAVEQAANAVRTAHPDANVGVFTGDLPAMTIADVDAALVLAEAHDRSMIPDEDGTGTTAILSLAGMPFTPRFGAGSRAVHEAAGHVPLDIPPTGSVRRDVDTRRDLAEAVKLGVGPHTSALLVGGSGLLAD